MITDNFRELPRPFPQNVCPASECCNPLVGLSRAALGSADEATLAHASSDAKRMFLNSIFMSDSTICYTIRNARSP